MVKGYPKECSQCNKIYLGGEGITRIKLDNKNWIDYPDDKGIGFEGVEEYEEQDYQLEFFCSKECLTKFEQEDKNGI